MIHARRRSGRLLALLLPLLLLAASCGGKKGSTTQEAAGDPVRGGSLTMGLEAETTDGWCLPEAQLAISGMQVMRAIYDTLTIKNSDGETVPYLAKSIEPSEDYKTWTITLRDGVTFHDGSALTAEVVKNNLDAYRGQYSNRPDVLLFLFIFKNIASVEVTGDLEVTVKTTAPWVAFPSFLDDRIGIMGQAQLDDQESCDRNLIGTGPFKLKSWKVNQELVATAYPKYWQEAPDGKPYPYLDEIHFKPITEAGQRTNALQAGEIDLMHTTDTTAFLNLRSEAESGNARIFESDDFAEVSFVQFNLSNPAIADKRIREAMLLSIDREDYKEVINQGLLDQANGPFAPGSIAYLEDNGYPVTQDLDRARSLIADYEAENGPIKLNYQATAGVATQQIAQYLKQAADEVGIEMTITTVEQAELIANAIAGDFDLQGFRNYPGGDPDELYVWFSQGSPANFARLDDAEVQRLLDEGRSEPDPAKRADIYKDLNRRLGSELVGSWANWTLWMIAGQPTTYGFQPAEMPKLPDGSDAFTGLAEGIPVHGLWVTE